MPLMKVTSPGKLKAGELYFDPGDILEMSEEDALISMEQGNAEPAPAGAVPSKGVEQEVDPIERDIRGKRFEEVRGSMQAPPIGPDGEKPARPGIAASLEGAERPLGELPEGLRG